MPRLELMTVVADLVSTIIPVHNRPQLIREAVQSVLEQGHAPIELMIVDDGSTDDTCGVVDELAAANPDIVKAFHIENGGPGAAREFGRRHIRGEFVQYLDSDDLLYPDKFSSQIEALRKRPECDVAYGMTRFHNMALGPNDFPDGRTGEQIETMFPAFLESRWWSTSTPLFRRSVVDRAGPWLPLLNEEDWEYDCRIASFGVRLAYVNQFVSETRFDGNPRLSMDGNSDPTKLRDRATAHLRILDHAIAAGLDASYPEMRRYARELFLLARQCAALGLGSEMRDLLRAARVAWPNSFRHVLELKLFSSVAFAFGARRAGEWCQFLDERRSNETIPECR